MTETRVIPLKDMQNGNGTSSAFLYGMTAGLLMTVALALARAWELTPLNIEMALGGIITRTIGTGTWVLGFFFHLLLAGSIATVYARGFKWMGRANWRLGAGFGVLHWIVISVAMGILPWIHEAIELFPPPHTLTSSEIIRPGLFGRHMGTGTVLSLLLVHLMYGAVVGELVKRRIASISLSKKRDERQTSRAA